MPSFSRAEPPRELSRPELDALRSAIVPLVPESELARVEQQFLQFLDELRAWNVRGNLVAAGDQGRLVSRHVVESLACVPLLDRLGGDSLLDLGAGGGFPGIPVKLVRPGVRLVLVESRRMKSLFLERVVHRLHLPEASVLQVRVEILGSLPMPGAGDHPAGVTRAGAGSGPLAVPPRRPSVDLVTARAVARLGVVAAWVAPLVRPGGHLVLFKGSRLEEELEAWKASPGPWTLQESVPDAGPNLTLLALRRTEDPGGEREGTP